LGRFLSRLYSLSVCMNGKVFSANRKRNLMSASGHVPGLIGSHSSPTGAEDSGWNAFPGLRYITPTTKTCSSTPASKDRSPGTPNPLGTPVRSNCPRRGELRFIVSHISDSSCGPPPAHRDKAAMNGAQLLITHGDSSGLMCGPPAATRRRDEAHSLYGRSRVSHPPAVGFRLYESLMTASNRYRVWQIALTVAGEIWRNRISFKVRLECRLIRHNLA